MENLFSFVAVRIASFLLYFWPVPFFIARQGDASFGVLSLLLLTFSYVHLVDLGFGYAMNVRLSRAIARRSGNSNAVIAGAIPVYISCAVLGTLTIVLAAPAVSNLLFGSTAHATEIRLLAGCVAPLMTSAIATSILQAYNKVSWINYSRLVLDVGRAAGMWLGALAENATVAVLSCVLLGTVARALMDLWLVARVRGSLGDLKPRWQPRQLQINLRFGLPMMASSMIGVVLTSADRVFVSRALDHEQLAYYSLAADICVRGYFIAWAVTGTLYTVMMYRRAVAADTNRLLELALGAIGLVVICLYLPLFFYGETIVSWWIAPDFAAATAPILQTWVAAAAAYMFMTVYYNYHQSAGRPVVLLVSSGVACVTLLSCLWQVQAAPDPQAVALCVEAAFFAQALVLIAYRGIADRRPARLGSAVAT